MNKQKILDCAIRAAITAGNCLRQYDKNAVESTAGRDIKHEADKVAEKCITNLLSPLGIPALAEESGASHGLNVDSHYWIIDPLDGTLNYSRSNPFCCVSIALWKNNEPVLGVIYDFNRDELFTGIVGEGAWLNGEPMRVSSVPDKSQAVLATGFPTFSDFSDESLLRFMGQVQQYKKIRLLGAAALSLAYVACGRVDAYMEEDIMLWDVAAGAALVKAAGGEISVLQSERGEWMRLVKCTASPALM